MNLKKIIGAVLIMLATACVLSAQKISGRVVDSGKRGIQDVIVSAFSTDSTFVAIAIV